ncbi:MAG: hypothetical protein IT425_04525 [Pirellulales bacterium]|nr:hypothetical protein [Pirellulales bacterium]
MASILPVPTTRVGDLFVRTHLTNQVQNDQLALFKLQNQVSTGRRLELPSDDAPAALRAIGLQRLLDRKAQIKTNIQSSNQYLSAAESHLVAVGQELIDLRAETVGIAGTLSNSDQRQSLIQRIDEAIETLVRTGNAQSQGRYLFAGSKSQVQPYDYNSEYVEYYGNEGLLRSYVDLERLFETNLSGTEVFGGISSQLQGNSLTPHLTDETLVTSLNGGSGISSNAAITLQIDTGSSTVTSVVDLSSAATMSDITRLIELGAPTGTSVTARITGTGLTLTTASGTISVKEVAQGHAAAELGILTPSNATPTSSIVGSSLNPAVLHTTPLENLLGTKSLGVIESASANNDILITAAENGTSFNDVRVIFVDDGIAGAETAVYDDSVPSDKTLTVHIESGLSNAIQVAAAITAEGTFTAVPDYHDAVSTDDSGTNSVEAADFGQITSGGSGEPLDVASGLVISNGDQSATLDTSTAETVEDLLNMLNGSDLGLYAEINEARTGINVRSRLSGADLRIGENGGTLATQLGIRTYTASTKLEDFNRGVGVPTAPDSTNNDLLITARDGTQLTINLSTADTVQDVIDLINGNSANNSGTTAVLARLATNGNGIELVDQSTVTTGDLIVSAVEGSQAAEYLGFVADGETQTSSNTTDVDGNYVLQSTDNNSFEVDSVFNTLIRLRQALQDNDTEEIGRSVERLDTDISRVNFARSEIGSRMQSLEVVETKLEDENVQLREALSNDVDVDLVEAISNLTARQYALQASLQTAASLLRLSLLDFI